MSVERLNFQDSQTLVEEWLQQRSHRETVANKRRNLIESVKEASRIMINSLSGESKEKKINKRIFTIVPEAARKKMGELYLQCQLVKTSETFSIQHQAEALWIPVRAMLCRDRFIFTCGSHWDSSKRFEQILEDILLHHIDTIGCADVEHSPIGWAVKSCEIQTHSRRRWMLGFRSNRVQTDPDGAFSVEAPISSGPTGSWRAISGSIASSSSRFLRISLSCYGEKLRGISFFLPS